MLQITAVYGAVLTLLFVVLSVRTLRQRHHAKQAIGHGEDKELLRRIRVHGNFAEYAPLALLMAVFIELQGASPLLVHLACGSLLSGRCLHAYGVSQRRERFVFRVSGMALTFTSLLLSSTVIIYTQFA